MERELSQPVKKTALGVDSDVKSLGRAEVAEGERFLRGLVVVVLKAVGRYTCGTLGEGETKGRLDYS